MYRYRRGVPLFRDAGNVAGLEALSAQVHFAEAGSETIKNAGPNWVISALSYAGFVLLWFASFTAALGANNKKKDVEYILRRNHRCMRCHCPYHAGKVANINTAGLGNTGIFVWNADIPNLILGRAHLEAFCILLCSRGICRYLYNSSAASV